MTRRRFACRALVCAAILFASNANAQTSGDSSETPAFEYSISPATEPAALLADPSITWVSNPRPSLNLGFLDHSVWIRFRVSPSASGLFFQNDYPPMDRASLFTFSQGQWQKAEAGDMLKLSERALPSRNVLIGFVPPQDGMVYVRFSSRSSIQIVPTIFTEASLTRRMVQEYTIIGIYCGLFLVMICYHLIVFSFLRDSTFVSYAAALLFTLLAQSSLSGILYLFLLGEHPAWNQAAVGPLMVAATAASTWFSISFLEARNYSVLADRMLRGMLAALGMLFVFCLFADSRIAAIAAGAFAGSVAPTVILTSAILVAWNGNKTTAYFLSGWILFLVGTIVRAAKGFGYLPGSFLTEHGQEIGSVIDVVLFSLAIGDRINAMRKEKIAMKRELELKGRLASVGQVAGAVAHDLNGPISIIRGYAEYLREGAADDQVRGQAEAIESETRYMESLTRDLLDFLRGEMRLDLKLQNAGDFLDQTLANMRAKAKARGVELNVIIRVRPGIPIDAIRMLRVIENLIGNALDVLKAGGKITVSAGSVNAGYRIEIHDNGPGIPESIRDRLFDPFVTANKAGGTGLGTAIARRIVQEHGGSLSFSTDARNGTAFFIDLPVEAA